MVKLKKYEQVEMFLSSLMQQTGFGLKELEALNYKEIVNAKELEGIGERTISNILIAFKVRQGIELSEKRATKKQLVEDYLTNLLESGELSQQEMLELCYTDLRNVAELAKVGKTTITTTLTEFKQKNDTQSFELGVLDFLAQEKSSSPQLSTKATKVVEQAPVMEIEQPTPPAEVDLNRDHVVTLKQMISEFQAQKIGEEEMRAYELRELKHALLFVGINPSKIVRLYWEDISRDFMNRKILSGKSTVSSQLQMSSMM